MDMIVQAVASICLVAILVIAAWTFHKARRVHQALLRFDEMLSAETGHLFHQVQAYIDLKAAIGIPLPPLRGWAASPDFLLVLARHALHATPEVIVECGSGATTLVLARCVQLNGKGHVISLEHDAAYAGRTINELKKLDLAGCVSVVYAPLTDRSDQSGARWYDLREMPARATGIDMLVVDGPPTGSSSLPRYPAMPLLSRRFARNCTVFLDDFVRAEERQTVERWLSEDRGWHFESIDCEKGCAKLWKYSMA